MIIKIIIKDWLSTCYVQSFDKDLKWKAEVLQHDSHPPINSAVSEQVALTKAAGAWEGPGGGGGDLGATHASSWMKWKQEFYT